MFDLIGINNRDLTSFETDLKTTDILAKRFIKSDKKSETLLVSESGLSTRNDLIRVRKAGAGAVLIGESLMRSSDIRAGLSDLICD